VTILQSLAVYYDRLRARGEASEDGYAPQKISFELVIAKNGAPVSLNDLRDLTGNKPVPRLIDAPIVERSSDIEPAFLWDKTAYSLGVTDTRTDLEKKGKAVAKPGSAKKTADQHAAFRTMHEEALSGSDDMGFRAFLAFLQRWTPDQFTTLGFSLEALDQNIVFRIDGKFEHLHSCANARSIWRSISSGSEAGRGVCLVTGGLADIVQTNPIIKGVRGANAAGAKLVSFDRNSTAYQSFGKSMGANAPISASAAFAYGTALNKLLSRNSGRSVLVGDATCVFWADARETGEKAAAAAEGFFGSALDPDDQNPDQLDAGRMRAAMEAISKGRAADVAPDLDSNTRIHVLGLSPNAGRIAVRFWHVGTFGELVGNLAKHWQDLAIDPNPFKRAPAAWALLYETALLREAKNIPPRLGGDLMRAVLEGGRYPQTLLAAVIGRIRVEGGVNGKRAAICKAVVQRNVRLSQRTEEIPVSLDKENPNAAYRLGRLFALYEWAETATDNRNATIRDKYFAAASTTPARVFPLLMRGSTHNLSKLRKGESIGLAVKLDKEITDVMGGLADQLPTALRLEEQGRFVVGYYHQMQARYAGKAVDKSDDDANEQEG